MEKVLYIKATPKRTENSWTLKMAGFFLQEYRKYHPDHIITELSLYDEPLNFLNEQDLHDMMQADKGDFAKYADQFLAHDKYVIAAPFWNYSVPAILRAYIDRIITVGKTFNYTEQGIVPAVYGKKSIFFMARGGVYSEGPLAELEYGYNYWQAIATTFLGLENKGHFIEGTELFAVEDVQKALDKKLPELRADAQNF